MVPASERTGSGHRRYTEADLRRLYRVRALRGLGLSLEEIGDVLGRSGDDLAALRDLLAAQLAELEVRAARMTLLKEQITGLLERLERSDMPDSKQFMAVLETISVFDTYFSQDLRDRLARRRVELGDEALAAYRAEWLALLRELREHMLAGTPPEDPRVLALCARWGAIGASVRIDDERAGERAAAAGQAMWRHHGAEISAGISQQVDWLEPGDLMGIMDYVRRAWPTGAAER